MSKKEETSWSQLNKFLSAKTENADEIIKESKKRAAKYLAASSETSRSRRKIMQETILPRVAAYAVLKESGLPADEIMGSYTKESVGPMMHDMYSKLEKVPFFFDIYKRIFIKATNKSDAWECHSKAKKNKFKTDIYKCLWNDTCRECGYPEACRFFCECDNYTYGNLKKMGFKRTQTLGTGGSKCDFLFYRK